MMSFEQEQTKEIRNKCTTENMEQPRLYDVGDLRGDEKEIPALHDEVN